jgi:uncharacterized tellurite resistance protein B-like protein
LRARSARGKTVPMIDALKALFRPGPAGAPRAEVAPDLAIAALLVEAARADGRMTDDDRTAVQSLLADMLDLDAAAARALRERGEAAQHEAADLVRFTRVIKMALDDAARLNLMTALWRVVLVDHHRDPHEDALLRRLAPLLAVSDHDSAAARRRALAG